LLSDFRKKAKKAREDLSSRVITIGAFHQSVSTFPAEFYQNVFRLSSGMRSGPPITAPLQSAVKGEGSKQVITFPNGDRYEGEVLNGKANGNGIAFFKNGARYEGHFRDNLQNGSGKMFYKNGVTFEGQFENDIPNGTGKSIDVNGSVTEGLYRKGKLEGLVRFQSSEAIGELTYVSGTMNGHAKLTYHNGDKFDGVFKDNKVISGICISSNGNQRQMSGAAQACGK